MTNKKVNPADILISPFEENRFFPVQYANPES